MPKIVAFVPAKGSSERINNKNLTILDGTSSNASCVNCWPAR